MKSKKGIKLLCFFLGFIFVFLPYICTPKNNAYANSTSGNTPYIEDEIILMFDSNASANEISNLIHSICPDATVIEHEDNYILLKLHDPKDLLDALEHFQKSNLILSAEQNYLITTMQLTEDTYSKSQWALENSGSYRSFTNNTGKKVTSTEGIDLNVSLAWELYNRTNDANKEVIVAIIDTGVDISHEDLAENIWINAAEIPGDGIDNDGNGYVDDINGWDFYNNDSTLYQYSYDSSTDTYGADVSDNDDHGTHCAGIIGAVANNGIGIAGVASNINIKLMPLKIEGGPKGNGTVSNAIRAIKYAENMGAKVCNISWGSTLYSSSLEQVMKESSMLFVAAAGNTGTNNNTSPVYPASYELDNVISVTFINANGKLTTLSNYGNKSVHLAAPGYDILSTTVGDSYGVMSGSSMAVPHISAIAAMIYASQDSLYPSAVKELILDHTTKLTTLEDKLVSPGIPNVLSITNSINTLKQDTKAPSLSCKTSYNDGSILVHLTTKDTGGSGIRVIKYLYGKHALEAFEHGTVGATVTDSKVVLSKSGVYTFYLSDYAGNEKKMVYTVVDDKEAPTISSTYMVSKDYKEITVTAAISDELSGVKQVKYMKGSKTAKDFKSASSGTKVANSDGNYIFHVSSSGTYTIYAVDYRGNKSVSQISVNIISATGLLIPTTKITLSVGDTYIIQPVIKPLNSTDQLTYKSKDKSIVTVTSGGKVVAKAKGTTKITITTSSGIRTTLTIHVT